MKRALPRLDSALAVMVLCLTSSCHDTTGLEPCSMIDCGEHGHCVTDEDGIPGCACDQRYRDDGLFCQPAGSDGDADGDGDGDTDVDGDADADGDGDGETDADGDAEECRAGTAGAECEICVRFVATESTGEIDGLRWSSAFTSVQEGIDAARREHERTNEVCEVWIAQGRYHAPVLGAAGSVQLHTGVHVYGGFAGEERLREDRSVRDRETTLDGCTDASCRTRAYHVLLGSPPAEGQLFIAMIDGVTIQNGAATGAAFPDNSGGGLLTSGRPQALVVRNCTFRLNSANAYGGAVLASDGSMASFVNTVFTGNHASIGGGIASVVHAVPFLLNCTFSGNTATVEGGGAATFEYDGDWTYLHVANSIFWNNTGGEIATLGSCETYITGTIVEGGFAEVNGDHGELTDVINADPRFVDPEHGDFRLGPGSGAIDAANGCQAPLRDHDGNERFDITTTTDTGRGRPADIGAFERTIGGEVVVDDDWLERCCVGTTWAGNSHVYWYCGWRTTWREARDYCAAHGTYLATAQSAPENDFIKELGTGFTAWLGATDLESEGDWEWITDEDWVWTGWGSHQPDNEFGNEHCLEIFMIADMYRGDWNDVPCIDTTNHFVCESDG